MCALLCVVAAVRAIFPLIAFPPLRPARIAAFRGHVYHEFLDGVSVSFLSRYTPDI
jgi:hypothetical protein